jgi:uncharacterized protein (DUF4415 family)
MNKPKPDPERIDAENPEWTARDLRNARPAREALPPSLLRKVGMRGPQKTPTKKQINIRLSQSVLDAFRAAGTGWQTRIDDALQDWLKTHKPA